MNFKNSQNLHSRSMGRNICAHDFRWENREQTILAVRETNFKTCIIIVLSLFGLESMHLSKSDVKSLNFSLNRLLMKLL